MADLGHSKALVTQEISRLLSIFRRWRVVPVQGKSSN
jgi:hypothetical protein